VCRPDGLRDNNMTELDMIRDLTKLSSLDLSHNNIRALLSAYFVATTFIKVDLSGNNIRRVEMKGEPVQRVTDTLRALRENSASQLGCITFALCEMDTFHAWSLFEGLDASALGGLKRLDLGGNNLLTLDAHVVALTSIEELHMDRNAITSIHRGLFSRMPLRTLTLGTQFNSVYAGLVTIADGTFVGQDNLVHLSLDGNNISTLSNYTFAGLSRLITLQLHENTVTTVHPGAFTPLVNLVRMSLWRADLSAGGIVRGGALYDVASAIPPRAFSGNTRMGSLNVCDKRRRDQGSLDYRQCVSGAEAKRASWGLPNTTSIQ